MLFETLRKCMKFTLMINVNGLVFIFEILCMYIFVFY